ncbi:MAG: efflux RND transporter periplasmic adaptor subunit [Alphaproteobacteria bacterium]|nr:efflux RND transporter periplasmic adaptor subunit [Alphaproteobacteria bacterium]
MAKAKKQDKKPVENIVETDEVGTRKKKARRTAIIVGCVAALCAGVVILKHVLTTGPFMYAGTLETTKVVVAARVASDISDVYVFEGDTVVRGQPLMELSCDTYKILAKQIDNDYGRAQALSERGHMSQAEFDVLTRNKQDNDLKLQWCRVSAPMDGIVITRFREPGEVVAPGTALISLANPYEIWAYFYVPYTMLHRLQIGQSVVGILPEADNRQFQGRIVKISEEAEFTPKNVQTREERTRLVYGVKVLFDNADLTLKAGMTIESALVDE